MKTGGDQADFVQKFNKNLWQSPSRKTEGLGRDAISAILKIARARAYILPSKAFVSTHSEGQGHVLTSKHFNFYGKIGRSVVTNLNII